MVYGEAHYLLVVTESIFAPVGYYIYLWPEATRLSKSHMIIWYRLIVETRLMQVL